MRLAVIFFTEDGKKLADKWKTIYGTEVEIRDGRKKESSVSNGQWLALQFEHKKPILFISACAIAVRMIAPFVKDKLTDSPVIVMDDMGQFMIPVLSGHVGGANELARELAEQIQAIPVITTATDIHDCFSVDLFAKKQGLEIVNKEGIAPISSMILRGEHPTVFVEEEWKAYEKEGVFTIGRKQWHIPKELTRVSEIENADICIGKMQKNEEGVKLYLNPKRYVLGIGCRKGKTLDDLHQFVSDILKEHKLSFSQMQAVVSIDKKKDEEGILQLCAKYDIPFFTYSAEELMAVQGDFHTSAFVRAQVGADNVCERAVAGYCRKKEAVIVPKQAENGITVAIGRL